jgi:hypothetical protein
MDSCQLLVIMLLNLTERFMHRLVRCLGKLQNCLEPLRISAACSSYTGYKDVVLMSYAESVS